MRMLQGVWTIGEILSEIYRKRLAISLINQFMIITVLPIIKSGNGYFHGGYIDYGYD